MYPYIVCFCGRSLGDIYELFKALKMEKYSAVYTKSDLDVDPALLALSEAVQVDLGDVFDILHIHMDCCRVRLMTQVEFKDLY